VRCPAFLGQWIQFLHSDERRTGESSKEGVQPGVPGGRCPVGYRFVAADRFGGAGAGDREGTLGNWVNVYRRDHGGEEPGLDVSERTRLRELERKYREVKLENEFLEKAAA